MKQGRSLQDLLAEVIRQQESKRDFVADTKHVAMVQTGALKGAEPQLIIGDMAPIGINDHAHSQIAGHCKIPAAYYDRMRIANPALLADNVNYWLHKEPGRQMIRTLDGSARAMVSDRFRALDNHDLLEAALPPLLDMGVEIMSCQVTETKLYLKIVDQRVKMDLPTGAVLGQGHVAFDTVSPALVISNSEVGCGALAVQTSIWTGGCTNLMVIRERSVRKYHVGGKHDLGDEVYRMLSDDTRRLTDAAVWAQLRDVAKGAFDRAKFEAHVERLKGTVEEKITGDPVKVVEVTAKRFGLNETERTSVLQHLIRGGSLTKYGLHAAVTRAAEDVESYDRASHLEALGGEIIELPRSEWKEIAERVRDLKEAA